MKNDEKKDTNLTGANMTEVMFFLIREIAFIILPLIVISIIFIIQYSLTALFHTPEWSFASALLFGQTIIRVSSATAGYKNKVDITNGFISIIIVLGLVPSLTFLTLMLVLDTPPIGLIYAQICLFILAIFTYFLLGGAFYAIEKEDKK
ncbi:hypothetical protein C0580_02545 [Candidatus Parcubacteria bacterium]|nr:MAG: hypothetical protein C0580_02545 [Candidatus Parcubacteria bacterium]